MGGRIPLELAELSSIIATMGRKGKSIQQGILEPEGDYEAEAEMGRGDDRVTRLDQDMGEVRAQSHKLDALDEIGGMLSSLMVSLQEIKASNEQLNQRMERLEKMTQGVTNHQDKGKGILCSLSTCYKKGKEDFRPPAIRVQFPKFEGKEPHHWIFKVERYFTYQNVPVEDWVILSGLHFEGEAMQWYRRLEHTHPVIEWNFFKSALLVRFGESPFTYYYDVELKNLKQTSTVEEYQRRFEYLAGIAQGWSTRAQIGVFIYVKAPLSYWNVIPRPEV
ncbi:uncharacterized protein LOC116263503 [Nymphaea colorata]|uniref:uncharacterized protein LOC116263503 n=1 Tax=Nymphaea colorata TaxID=210225 RepID=UPI00129ED882|nr:uncharacterized protein LOC116263503 [Nymphaea colorata]